MTSASLRVATLIAALAGVVIAWTPAAGIAGDSLRAATLPWQNTAADHGVVRGTFRQEKHLAELDRPLVSTGHFVAARGHGLIWQVEQPISTRLVVTGRQLVERNGAHQTARITAAQQPGLSVVAAMLMAVFQGDTNQLRRFFRIERHAGDSGSTELTLRPKTTVVQKFVRRVQIAGRQHIERLRIDRPGGDYSVIDLNTTPQSSDATETGLSADEKAAFSR